MTNSALERCGKLTATGEPCNRLPGHGGSCIPGDILTTLDESLYFDSFGRYTPPTVNLNRQMLYAGLWVIFGAFIAGIACGVFIGGVFV